MANLLTFFRPFRHENIRSVLLIQSGPIDLTLQVGERLRAMFPDCDLEALVREDHREAASRGGFTRLLIARWEDRLDVVRTLRRRRYDTVVVLMSHRGSDYLRVLPYFLRTRSILAFNDNLDSFPLHATRIATLALHVSGRDSASGLLRWAVGRAVIGILAVAVLVASVLRIQLRARWRQTRVLVRSRV